MGLRACQAWPKSGDVRGICPARVETVDVLLFTHPLVQPPIQRADTSVATRTEDAHHAVSPRRSVVSNRGVVTQCGAHGLIRIRRSRGPGVARVHDA
jgi:hypothetical protein